MLRRQALHTLCNPCLSFFTFICVLIRIADNFNILYEIKWTSSEFPKLFTVMVCHNVSQNKNHNHHIATIFFST